MGFPVWTLWGMALTAVGALVTLLLAFLAQSPRLLKRLGLSGYRLDLRARTFTGYALAFLVLSMGFFLAGVPLGPQVATPLAAAETPTPTATALPPSALVAGTVMPEGVPVATTILATAVATLESDTDEAESTDSTGAFGSGGGVATVGQTGETAVTPAPPIASDDAVEPTLSAGAAPEADAPAPNTATPTLVPSPTPTPSPTTTASPTPTLTPTAIAVESAVLDIGNSTLWLKRTPGGQDLSVLPGDTVLLIWPGRANMGGTLWREVSTLDGVVGWVEERYLAPDTAESQP